MSDPTPTAPDPAVTSLTAKAGDKVDNYTIMEQVGAGGTAIVFRGHDHVLNRDVAIKQIVVPTDEAGEDVRQRAMAEAEIHKRVAASDPRLLVQYIDTINDDRGLFLISEYIDGPSLEWMLQQDTKPMEQRRALGFIAATAKALEALHKGGVVHRDLKPSNILMPREGGLKLADFGLAAIVSEQQTMDLGSVRYMAPEVLQGQTATPKSDLYSLGMVAYEMLAGRDRFNEAFRTILRDQRNQSMRWVKWHTNARAKVAPLDQLVSGIPASLSQLIARMMEKDPARRVGSATELIDAIRLHFVEGGQEEQAPAPHAAMAPPKIDDVSQTAAVPQKSKLPVILAATLVVWVLAIGGFFVWKNQENNKAETARINALIADIEDADRLIRDQDYTGARDAFAQIPKVHTDQFDPDQPRYRDDLVQAGVLKAEALLAAQSDDYITARDKSKQYRKSMSQWSDQPAVPRTGLSLANAKEMVEEYDTRAAFQELADGIAAMLAEGELENAIQAIRRTRNNASVNTAAQDTARLDELEARYHRMVGDERVNALLAEARKLRDEDELREAIDLLEDERDDQGDNVDARVTTLLEDLNKRQRIATIQMEVARAERSGDRADLLAALKDLRSVQPTQALDVRINDLEIAIMVEQAEEALADSLPEKAQQILGVILERDPNNAQAKRMLGSIKDARMKIAAETRGDQLKAEEKYEEAIAAYKEALIFGPDTNGGINNKIQECNGRIHFLKAEKALEDGDVVKAQEHLDLATAALGDTDAIAAVQTRISDLRDYTMLTTEGDNYFASGSFGRAKVKYLAAKKIFDSEAINQKVRDCDFGIWLSQCDNAILTRDWEAAESALKRAEEIKTNAQTKARRTKIESRIQ